MSEQWIGARKKSLRLLGATARSDGYLRESADLLRAPREAQERMMEDTLSRVRRRALRSPADADTRRAWERIGSLEDLTRAPCTSANTLPTMSPQPPDWSNWVADHHEVIATAATGGSSALSKVMPFAAWSLEHYAWSSVPHLAEATLARGVPAKRTALALTAPRDYVTYLAIPPCFTSVGYDVVHVPLAAVLREADVARDLIDWLLEPGNDVHAISTVTAMLPMFLRALDGQPGGAEAIGRLQRTLRLLYIGGSELTPALEATLATRLGLGAGACVNVFASTESGMVAASRSDFAVFRPSLHTHALTILPLDEIEKADADPGYTPRGALLTRAPVGLIGELASTFDAAAPWINLRQGDVFEVVAPEAGSDVPRLRYQARMSSVHDVGGGRVWPASYQRAVQRLEGRVTDYLAMAMKPGDTTPEASGEVLVKDRLVLYYEGESPFGEVARSILETIPMLNTTGPKLGAGTFDMAVYQLEPGTLARCRQRKSAERGGAPGPLKHHVVRGPQYHVPPENVLSSGPGW